MRIVLISDTHLNEIPVPDGDLLIHAGDLLGIGTERELGPVMRWLGSLPHRHKVVIAGNHDWVFQRQPDLARSYVESAGATYLQDEEVTVGGLRIYGSPWQPEFMRWAFNLPRGQALAEKWAKIPIGLDILVTHCPPYRYGDRTLEGEMTGCEDLAVRLDEVAPRLHVFGHIHPGHGYYEMPRGWPWPIPLVNVAICNDCNVPVYPPFVLEWDGAPVNVREEWGKVAA